MWPDLDRGLLEVGRVLRLGGRLLLAWHAADSPDREQRRLALGPGDLDSLTGAIRTVFGGVKRHDLTRSVVWEARRGDLG